MARFYLLNWAAGVSRFYWYAWDNHDWVTLYMTGQDSRTPTAAARAYARVQEWIVGKRMESCQPDSNGTWSCRFADRRASQWILWNPDENLQVVVPKIAPQDTRLKVTTLSGRQTRLQNESIPVGPSPVLVEVD